MNRTIIEKARTISIDSNLPKFLLMWGMEPKLSNIRPIGSQLFYSIHHYEKIGKLDPRCKKGVLVGFDEEMKSYRVWDRVRG